MTFKESKMKLKKQKLEQLIMEEFKTMSQKVFDKQGQPAKGELIRVFGDKDQPVEYPEYADKLRALYIAGEESRAQAIELADALGEPIDIELSDNMEKIPLAPEKRYNPRTNIKTYGTKPEHQKYGTWHHYVMNGYTRYFEDPIREDDFEEYVEYGEDNDHFQYSTATPEEEQNLRKKLEAERKDIKFKYHTDRRRFNWQRKNELEDLYGWDLYGRTWMESKMKLTKQKLEELIMEEYVRRVADEGKPTNYPEYADKLTALAKNDPAQARELADALDEPLDVEFDPANMTTIHSHRTNIDRLFDDHDLHVDFLMQDHVSSLTEEPDKQEVYIFAQRKGLDPQETYNSIMRNYKRLMLSPVNLPKTEVEQRREIEKILGVDLRPDWMKRNHYD